MNKLYLLPDDIQYIIWKTYFSRYIIKYIIKHSKKFRLMHKAVSFNWNSYYLTKNIEYV